MNPKIYLVGGAVRDKLLGLEPKDLDYVVVGANFMWMLDRGFKPVGASFPVYLHPQTGAEYALARREKKIAPGYQGFEFEFGPDVTIEEDLSRRDLTINSIAYDYDTETYIDPFNGRQDLKDGIIRHTSDAFAEDPLRVLRVARFAARYQFLIAPETEELCKKLVNSGELDALSGERVWGELEKLLSENRPSIGLRFLSKIEALHSVKRLACLVLDPPIDYKSHYDHDIEPDLTMAEKIYFNLNIQGMSKDQLIEQFKVPTHVVRETMFYDSIYNLLYYNVNGGEDQPEEIVSMFDAYREEIKRGDLHKIVDLVIKCIKDNDRFSSNG